jgi:hypothetical protein
MFKRLSKSIGVIVVLVGIIALLIPNTVEAAIITGTTHTPDRNGSYIHFYGETAIDCAYDTVQCETQLWYQTGGIWVNLAYYNDVRHNTNIAWVSENHLDTEDGDYKYKATSYHYYYDSLLGTGSFTSYAVTPDPI